MPLFSSRPSAIQFDASRHSFQGDRNGTKVWHLPEGGGLGRYSFQTKPDIPEQVASVAELRAFYERFGFRLHSYRQVGSYYVSRYELQILQP